MRWTERERYADPVDAGSASAETERDEIVARRRREREARPVNRSGRCAECGDAIDPRRLEIDPCAVRCLSCQEEIDLRDRIRGDRR